VSPRSLDLIGFIKIVDLINKQIIKAPLALANKIYFNLANKNLNCLSGFSHLI